MPFDAASQPLSAPRWRTLSADEGDSWLSLTLAGRPLIQLRLARARRLLAQGQTPAEVAMALGFADQSHLGRWFRRAYRLTPADYRRRCSNLPD